ncbi:RING finger protein 17 [Hyla sarda]|uniref:RING finger protein 17 n=1 Tax=Hyla sarda TaxID=327740 RepID=UPI0024C2BAF5|nr:RING finger protein 17 [Hyla sarda]
MADGEWKCDSCHHSAGDCLEKLPCGHCVCGVCSCRMESLTIMCPVCEGCEPEECEIVICSEDLSIQSQIPVQLLANEDSNMSMDDNSGSKMKQAANENSVIHAMDTGNDNPGDCEDNLCHNIDEALIIANDKLHHLNSTLQTLKEMDARNKQLERRVSHSVHEAFGKMLLALRKRKSDILYELKAISEIKAVELQNAIRNIEEQRKCLETRAAFAEGLKMSPSLTMYCDLNQLVTDLKMSFKNEDTLDSLKGSSDIRFNIDCNTMLKTIDSLGTICIASNPKSQVTFSVKTAFKESQHLDVKSEHKIIREHLKDCSKALDSKQCESDFGCMDIDEHSMETTSQLASGKDPHNAQDLNLISLNTDASPQSMSTPDVIIEEIIEEDQPCKADSSEPQNDTALDCTKEKSFGESFTSHSEEFSHGKPKRFKNSQRMTGTCAPFCQKKTPQELVYLSHWQNPCNFYVRCFSQRRRFILLDRMLTSLSRTCSQCYPTDVLEQGEIIAFKSTTQRKWCRGNIIQLIPLESKCIPKPCGPTRYKIEDITRLSLFLLDYGSSETFVAKRFAGSYSLNSDPVMDCETKVTSLHTILSKLSSATDECIRFMPPFAVHCSLDIVPQSPDGMWKKEIKDHVLKVIGNKCVLMKVLREENRKLIVDLKTPFENKISSDMPLSLREALVFLELAKFPSNGSGNTGINHYIDPILPKNMTKTTVIVCHMNDPSDFYIQLVCESNFPVTMNKMQEVYNSKEADDLHILHPVVGQPCVAKYVCNDEEQWYRAEIRALCNTQEAVIKYVDFGNFDTVNIAALRSLKKEFMTEPLKAIGCRLAYIQPLDAGPFWTPEACLLFEQLTYCKHLNCTSIGMLLENKLSVELFDVNPSYVMSINTMLVEEKVASFIQCSSYSAEHLPLKEVWDPVLELSPNSMEMCLDNISLFERKELDVFISHVVSPSKIYVQWLTTENILKSLQAAMFERYENSKPEAVQWQVDMKVAVQLQSNNQWTRGKVINVISDSFVEVFCYDFGTQEVKDVTNIRTLDESMMVYGTMCLECSLMDIKPAGGSQNWTATACDFLSHYLKGATVTMVIEDDTSQWPLPVKILSKNEASQLVDVSEFLVKKGLALRDKRPVTRKNKTNSVLESKDISAVLPVKSCLPEPVPVEELTSESKPECDKKVKSEQNGITEHEEPVMEPIVGEPYLPPVLPDEKTFLAKVHHVGDDGAIYVVQECLENELSVLMVDIQNSFKCLGLKAPYSWRKGEGCLIKGSDTMLYRGKVLDILSGDMITVQYEDFGYTEKIPRCHLCPSVFNPHIPGFSIPCQLNDILPVGDRWQPDAIQFLKELLLERVVTIHIVKPPNSSHGIAFVRIYCGSAPVSDILEQYAYGIPRGCEKRDKTETYNIKQIEKIWNLDFQELLNSDLGTPLLPNYSSESLPHPGELFKVEVTHLQTPKDVFIRLKEKSNGDDDGDCDPLKSTLKKINSEGNELLYLTDFRTAMPCLATYRDGLLHRAKLQSIKSYDPVTCVVEFVDYGNTAVLDVYSLFQLPPSLIQYPAKAIKVKLAGFKPPKNDFQDVRILYCPEWSIKALYDMMDIVEKKTLTASCVTALENTVFLYDENNELVHKPLVAMGLAELEEM